MKGINPKFAIESECNHIYYTCILMLLSDIWSRSNFWVTLLASWVLMSVKQLIHSPIYRLNQSLLLQMLASFPRSVWFQWNLWPKMALEMSQEFRTISLDITSKASPRLSLVEKFAENLSIIPFSQLTPKPALACVCNRSQTASFFILTDRSILLIAKSGFQEKD